MDMITQGFIAACTLIWLLSYLPVRRVFGYALLVDILCTGTLIMMFAGSYAGMMTGVIAGLMISMFLRVGRALFGAERLTVARRKNAIAPSIVWRDIPPVKWRNIS